MRRAAPALGILSRVLLGVAGFLLFYGIEPMMTSSGLRPPNIVVLLALAAIVLVAAATWRSEGRPVGGLWVAGVVVGLPLLLQSITRMSAPACPPDHPPLTQSYYCVAPGAPIVVAISAVVLALSLIGAYVELGGLLARTASRARSG